MTAPKPKSFTNTTTAGGTTTTRTTSPQGPFTVTEARVALRLLQLIIPALLSAQPHSTPAAPKPMQPNRQPRIRVPDQNQSRTQPQLSPLPPQPLDPASASPASSRVITIDTSTRIMGHCNTITLPSSPSPAHSAARIEELVSGMLAAYSSTQSEGGAGRGGMNINIQAGINVIGSRNVIVMGSDGAEAGAGEVGEVDGIRGVSAGEGGAAKRKRGMGAAGDDNNNVEQDPQCPHIDREEGARKRVKVEA